MAYIFNSFDNKDKQFCNIKTLEDIEILKKELNSHTLSKFLEINLNLENYSPEVLKQIELLLKSVPTSTTTSIMVQNDNSSLAVKNLENFIDFEENLKKEQKELYFKDSDQLYTLTETINAQEQIETFSEKLNSSNASPFEKYLMIYNFLTRKIFNENNKNPKASRHIIAVLNGNNIVCVGYAQIMQRLCKEANIPCYTQSSSIYDNDDNYRGGHRNNIVKLKDDKYGIDGLFYADACWDSVKQHNTHQYLYNYCLIPLSDKDKIKTDHINVEDLDLQYYFYTDQVNALENNTSLPLWQKQHGLDRTTQQEMELFESQVYNAKKRQRACKRLITTFKKYEIPENIYSYNVRYPKNANYNYILALLMEDKIDETRLHSSMCTLKQIKTEQDSYSAPSNQTKCSYMSSSAPKDIYKFIEEIAGLKTTSEQYNYTYKEGYTEDQVMTAVMNKDNKLLKEMEFNVTITQVPFMPTKWQNVVNEMRDINDGRKVEQHINNLRGQNSIISYESFKKGLYNTFILSGIDPKTAEKQTEQALTDTKKRSDKIFMKTATNCFVTERAADHQLNFDSAL